MRRRIFLFFSGITSLFAFAAATVLKSSSPLKTLHPIVLSGIGIFFALAFVLRLLSRRKLGALLDVSFVLASLALGALLFEWGYRLPELGAYEIRRAFFAVIPMLSFFFFTAFGLFAKFRALGYALGLYLLLLFGFFYTLNKLPRDPHVLNALAQPFVLANLVYIALVMLLIKVRETHAASLIETIKTETLALTDELSGLPNRKALRTQLDQEHARFIRYGIPYALILVDLDRFKRFNEAYGRDKGDTVLREISALLRTHSRKGDTMGRWGGEEFLGIVAAASHESIALFAERLRAAVETHRTPGLPLTTGSLGIAIVRAGERVSQVLERADAALATAKRLGANRAEFSPEVEVVGARP